MKKMMKKKIFLFPLLLICVNVFSQEVRTIHVFVALCDNINQGIIPVPERIGNGQNPATNLYWGCGYGVKTYFSVHSGDWQLLQKIQNPKTNVLERLIFKHKTTNTYLLADAYDGAKIKACTIAFLRSSAGDFRCELKLKDQILRFGGNSDLVAYIGHDGLMDFSLDLALSNQNPKKRDAIILACYSKEYFMDFIKNSGAHPLLWTNGLMAPEAYTLEWALDGWVANETDAQIKERAAQAYNQYQKCGIKGARWLLQTGF
jgi:hypothetical protein